jgi:nitrilase
MGTSSGPLFNVPGGGSSAIFGPDGRLIASGEQDGLTGADEGIIYADLEMDDHMKARGFVDACGHYSRPDMLWLGVDLREKLHVRVEGDSLQPAPATRLSGDSVEKIDDPSTMSNGFGEHH